MRAPILVFAISFFASSVLAGDWSGPYVGGQASMRNGVTGADGGGVGLGLHGGYNIDLGNLVLGGEFEYEHVQLLQSGSGNYLNNVGRLKLRAGRDFGATMAYAIFGGVNGDTTDGSETGIVYGLGLVAEVGDRVTLSGEALRQVFDNFASAGRNLKTDSLSVRVSFRF